MLSFNVAAVLLPQYRRMQNKAPATTTPRSLQNLPWGRLHGHHRCRAAAGGEGYSADELEGRKLRQSVMKHEPVASMDMIQMSFSDTNVTREIKLSVIFYIQFPELKWPKNLFCTGHLSCISPGYTGIRNFGYPDSLCQVYRLS